MEFSENIIDCRNIYGYENSNRYTSFNVAKTKFDYLSNSDHKRIIDKLINRGKILAKKVNPAAANNSTQTRKKERLINNATAGLMAEYCWKQYINQKAGSNIVDYTEFSSAATQIDLYILNNKKTIEVRSSFPRNGIDFAICDKANEFDILGPYSNTIKPGEIQKDYYTRTLYHIPGGKSFLELVTEDSFYVYLTGGATWEMMTDGTISKNKDLVPEDSLLLSQNKSTFRVVPFSKALDTIEIFNLINSTNS